MMVRSASAEPVKPSKRKGTRSVSTLTPSQLARKRANDREAQRAIRARTKEHIERLERELEELKSNQSRDKTVQELLRRNKALEEELFRIKETMGVSMTPSPYQSAGKMDSQSTLRATSILTFLSSLRRQLEHCQWPRPQPEVLAFPSDRLQPNCRLQLAIIRAHAG
jgi:serine phosphatase RsbU (regulator of sigma subunit)